MANNLVIIESPFKINTIKSCLGSNYKVIASVGHVRDLPKSSFGIDIENGFEPHYINIHGKGDVIKSIRAEAKKASKIFLATDPDREGEAISWHLATTLGIPAEDTLRITFNELTKTAIKAAVKNPRPIDMNLVNAQQSRRILDRIVGYKLSPLLWKKIRSGLSAGRVQSVATRIIVEREEEIRAFVPVEYWTISALLEHGEGCFTVRFFGDAEGNKLAVANEQEAMAIVSAVSGKPFKVAAVKRGTKQRQPAPPFITSTLQQEASRKLGFNTQRTMKVAQELYEGINLGSENGGTQGLITYMRTDSQRVSSEAQESTREYVKNKYGVEYVPAKPRVYKTRQGAQDAHEAIRPTRVELEPWLIRARLTDDQWKLYRLIWARFVASQMESARLSTLNIDLTAGGYLFRTGGYSVSFPGFMALYEESSDETKRRDDEEQDEVRDIKLPELREGELLDCRELAPTRHFTEAPPRFTEASLVKFLEENGLGRPSTFATIVTTIISREYVSREGKSLVPTELGVITTDMMKESFPDIVDYKFTANMESRLDGVESGSTTMNEVLSDFWKDFEVELNAAEEKARLERQNRPVETTDIICENCGATMIVKSGRYGKFAACPNYPECKNTKPLTPKKEAKEEKKELVVADFKCEKCGGDMVLRQGPYGGFYACINYPKCKYIKQILKEIDVPCPKCGGSIVVRRGKSKNSSIFYGCANYPSCDFASRELPTREKCPTCGGMLFAKKGQKPGLICHTEGCDYFKPDTEGKDSKK